MSASALLFATTASHDGRCAAALPAEGGTVVGRLVAQLATLGVRDARVVTRPAWEDSVRDALRDAPAEVAVAASPGLAEDLRAAAAAAGVGGGALLLGEADVVVHRQALAGLLADPRLATAVLATDSAARGRFGLPLRSVRGRLTAASSAYHRVRGPNAWFLGLLKVAGPDRDRLGAAAARLAELAADPPAGWQRELERKVQAWRAEPRAGATPPAPGPGAAASPPAGDEAPLDVRVEAARRDAVALLVVGLVRGGAHVGLSFLRGFFHARPLSQQAAATAATRLRELDEDRIALDAAVKATDGFFTTFFVSPYSRYLARFAARRGLTPNAVTTISVLVGVAAAAAFALGSRVGLIGGALLLQASFTIDCVDGQLARYTRTFTKLGAWLDSVFDRTKEYVVYAGLAIGSTRGFGDDVWLLATCAITLQTSRHMLDFSYGAAAQRVVADAPQRPLEEADESPAPPEAPARAQPVAAGVPALRPAVAGTAPGRGAPAVLRATAHGDAGGTAPRVAGGGAARIARSGMGAISALDRRPATLWAKRMIVLPIGERFALISLTAALWSPRVTFTALLAWGAVAAAYSVAGRVVRSVPR